ncbi:MAG: signal peptidase II [Clostridiales bacterium]|nr:signal peptidase II [Clostridiales bacterium]
MYNPRHSRVTSQGRLGYFLSAVVIFAVDQISKDAVLSMMRLGESIPVIPGFFYLTFIMNSGASFGMMSGYNTLFIVVSVLAITFLCWAAFFLKNMSRSIRILLGVISGGALGNLADRLQHDAVVDFLDFRGIWSYIFNVADSAVVCGGTLLALFVLYEEWKDRRKEPKHLAED